MHSAIYVGLDIGGTLSKVSVASETLSIAPSFEAEIGSRKFTLHSRSFSDVFSCLSWLEETIKGFDIIKLAVTGGGAVKFDATIRGTFPSAQISSLNEYQSNIKGLSFIKSASIPVTLTQFTKNGTETIKIASNTITLKQCELPLEFISLGSGVNYHKIAEGKDGYERIRVEDPSTSYDGLLLDGTCLGGGYVFGLIRLLSQQSDSSKIIELIKTDSTYSKIYEQLLINLMQTAISLSAIHHIPTIIANGSILSIRPLNELFQKAMLLSLMPTSFKRSLISLDALQGYLGCVGALYSAIPIYNNQ